MLSNFATCLEFKSNWSSAIPFWDRGLGSDAIVSSIAHLVEATFLDASVSNRPITSTRSAWSSISTVTLAVRRSGLRAAFIGFSCVVTWGWNLWSLQCPTVRPHEKLEQGQGWPLSERSTGHLYFLPELPTPFLRLKDQTTILLPFPENPL